MNFHGISSVEDAGRCLPMLAIARGHLLEFRNHFRWNHYIVATQTKREHIGMRVCDNAETH